MPIIIFRPKIPALGIFWPIIGQKRPMVGILFEFFAELAETKRILFFEFQLNDFYKLLSI